MSGRMVAGTAVAGLIGSLLVLAPAAGTASAAPAICDRGTTSVKWVQTSHSRVLTHKVKGYEKGYSGGKRTISKTLAHDKTLSSDRTITSGVNAGFSVAKVLASLDAHVEGTYTRSKGKTTSKSVTVTDELTKKGRYFFYLGRLKASGYWQGYKCDGGTKWLSVAHGTAKSFGASVDGAVRCGEKVSGKSIGALVQKKYC
ncbi:hypothetical protein [Streptomyces sp. NPDC007088]|uniref:hypothetical protein n=1 Tax=Streptomyces sp. NPDC007088 TaxID=3364773 RepID=UPI0036B1C007